MLKKLGAGAVRLLVVACLVGAIAPACGSSPQSTTCTAGTERCACYGNGTCNAGLACLSSRCVAAATGGSSGTGGPGGQSGAGAGGNDQGRAGDMGTAGTLGAGGGIAGAGGGGAAGAGGSASTGGAPAGGGAAGGRGGTTGAAGTTGGRGGNGGSSGATGGGGGTTGGTTGSGGAAGETTGSGGAGGTSAPNLVPNGDFSNGLTGWQITDNGNASFQVIDGALCVTFPNYGTATIGTTGPLFLTGGITYEFSFKAWTTIPMGEVGSVRAKVGEAGPPYTSYTLSYLVPTAAVGEFTPLRHARRCDRGRRLHPLRQRPRQRLLRRRGRPRCAAVADSPANQRRRPTARPHPVFAKAAPSSPYLLADR